ncbi:hypothetical protein [uncultured Limimaricola sp.]|uniref:hypothetical protein n=1 Tax=uncultured Limimaricola sp. TaxID=2211667 RepID=UPI0030F51730
MGWGLVLPVLGLALAGWAVPRLLAAWFPEGVRPLLCLGLTAAMSMLVLSMALFLVLYLAQGVPLDELARPGWGALAWHLARLGLGAALIWGPILVLSVAGLPRHWRHETW